MNYFSSSDALLDPLRCPQLPASFVPPPVPMSVSCSQSQLPFRKQENKGNYSCISRARWGQYEETGEHTKYRAWKRMRHQPRADFQRNRNTKYFPSPPSRTSGQAWHRKANRSGDRSGRHGQRHGGCSESRTPGYSAASGEHEGTVTMLGRTLWNMKCLAENGLDTSFEGQ